MNAQITLNSAIAAGFDRLSTRDVMLCILQGAGSGGTGGSSTLYQNFGGVAPVAAGTTTGQLAIDNSTGQGWVWSGSAWVSLF